MTDVQAQDEFAKTFFARIPKESAHLFTPEHVEAVRTAFSPREHLVDIRTSFGSLYIVLLAGKDLRRKARVSTANTMQRRTRLANTFVIAVLCFFLLLAAVGTADVTIVGTLTTAHLLGWDGFRGALMGLVQNNTKFVFVGLSLVWWAVFLFALHVALKSWRSNKTVKARI